MKAVHSITKNSFTNDIYNQGVIIRNIILSFINFILIMLITL